MTFTLASVTEVGNVDWFNIDTVSKFREMCSYTNNTGGLELYCVNWIINNNTYGMHSSANVTLGDARRGMAVRTGVQGYVLAHELGHACGLRDLYGHGAISGLVTEEKVGTRNWSGGEGTGYYFPVLYSEVMSRALMHNQGNPTIPLDLLRAIIKYSGGMQGGVSVGLNQMSTRDPRH